LLLCASKTRERRFISAAQRMRERPISPAHLPRPVYESSFLITRRGVYETSRDPDGIATAGGRPTDDPTHNQVHFVLHPISVGSRRADSQSYAPLLSFCRLPGYSLFPPLPPRLAAPDMIIYDAISASTMRRPLDVVNRRRKCTYFGHLTTASADSCQFRPIYSSLFTRR